ncbi:DUF1054 domain-containing protein [Lactococcus kimchii]|uniref:DUF1054 domain-containing protein n=1 Tax=Lactococcus sp. S-13 TaxID=2507158 RepID=UPI0010235943|nr:DUF1054 domain-containing protein [Lactococcus sp. S-13]RZI48961.1 DUF1054 domain-containing protein [Lactococcus sp. S-13]
MFTHKSFEVFDIVGLEARMTAIRSTIQPIFSEIGEKLVGDLQTIFPDEAFYLHIAQHRRRTTHAPENTWSAISTQKRGYKMEAHYQLGIWQDYVFLYLSIIDQPKKQQKYAQCWQELLTTAQLPGDFVLSKDHTKAEFFQLDELPNALERLGKVKKAELEVGKIWPASRFDGQHDEEIEGEIREALRQLSSIYRQLMEVK